MSINQFFSIDFAEKYPEIFYYDTKPITYELHLFRVNSIIIEFKIDFKLIPLICKSKYLLYREEKRDIFIDWFTDYARSMITEDNVAIISGTFIL